MCRLTVDLSAEAVTHGRPGFDFSDALARLQPLADEGLVTLNGSQVTVTGDGRRAVRLIASCFDAYLGAGGRSEEHTSELQSLMRISYAVFCLKKKKNKSTEQTNTRLH